MDKTIWECALYVGEHEVLARALLFATNFFNPQQKYLLRDKITQGEKREPSIQNLQRNNVVLQVEGFCVSYFAVTLGSHRGHRLSNRPSKADAKRRKTSELL